MPRNWYGNAQSARQATRTHNGALSLSAVGGMNSKATVQARTVDPQSCRAIYGSTDNAAQDATNSVLCRALDTAKASALHSLQHYTGPQYGPNVHRYAPSMGAINTTTAVAAASTPSESPASTPSEADIAWLTKRATSRHMTLVEYCATIGIVL